MGPQLILDKSTLQSLTYEESRELSSYYYLVYTPVLFIEVLGDLKKIARNYAQSVELVGRVAGKIHSGDSVFNAHHLTLLESNLLGGRVEMKGRPLVDGGLDVVAENGERGVFFDEPPERIALRRWLAGEFSEAEHALAERWRASSRSANLEQFCGMATILPPVKSLEDLGVMVSAYADDPRYQIRHLKLLLSESRFPEAFQTLVFKRWLHFGRPLLRVFTPYGHYCLRVYLLFYLGIANSLLGTRSTNRVDLEYLLYLPFCLVFSSGDKFHRSLAPLLMREDQHFIESTELKRDIARILEHWRTQTPQKRREYRLTNGNHPPDWPDSVTNIIWKKQMRPREECRPLKMTPERNKEIMERMRPMLDAIAKAQRSGLDKNPV